MLSIGDTAPPFSLPDQSGEIRSSDSFAGKWAVLWWYPEANSEGCSMQAASLDRASEQLDALDVVVVGASFNSAPENDDFAEDKALGLTLLSDPERVAGEKYEVIREPGSPYDTKPLRLSYIIDPAGKIAYSEDAGALPLGKYGDHIVEVITDLQSQ